MNKRITAIICAMEEEAAAFRSIEQDDVRIIKSGVGKVHAAVATVTAIEQGATQIISTGYAGALSSFVKKGDFVLAIISKQHDVDATPLGSLPGHIPYADHSEWMSCPVLSGHIIHATVTRGYKLHAGIFLSGDQFITNRSQVQSFGGICVDMETAAIAQACHLRQVPYASIRIISDEANAAASDTFTRTIRTKEANLEEAAHIIKTALRTYRHDVLSTSLQPIN